MQGFPDGKNAHERRPAHILVVWYGETVLHLIVGELHLTHGQLRMTCPEPAHGTDTCASVPERLCHGVLADADSTDYSLAGNDYVLLGHCYFLRFLLTYSAMWRTLVKTFFPSAALAKRMP